MAEREVLSPAELGREGEAAYRRGEAAAAERLFLAAAEAYHSAGQADMALEMQNNRSVALLDAGQAAQALELAAMCAAEFGQLGDRRRQALALGNQAAALEALNRLEEAESLYQQAADWLKQQGDDQTRLYVMQAISKLQFRRGQQLQALATMQAGVEGLKKPSLKQKLLKRLLRLPMNSLGVSRPTPPDDDSA